MYDHVLIIANTETAHAISGIRYLTRSSIAELIEQAGRLNAETGRLQAEIARLARRARWYPAIAVTAFVGAVLAVGKLYP